uniref:Uncharacterized protein n=1 Tax=Setaria italica TaxID=4555 RepID=K3Z1S2_SETIT
MQTTRLIMREVALISTLLLAISLELDKFS